MTVLEPLFWTAFSLGLYIALGRYVYWRLTKDNEPDLRTKECRYGPYDSHRHADICWHTNVKASRNMRIFLAVIAPLSFPVVFLRWACTWKQPLTEAEMEKRKEKLRQDIEKAEKELNAARREL